MSNMQIFERYQKQILFDGIGLKGQKELIKATIGILGVGALGTNIASICARSGVGKIILVDDDKIELSNLQRQMLFKESDIGYFKADTAARNISEINSDIQVKATTQRLNNENFKELFDNCDILMDATDNFKSRFILNEQTQKWNIPWIHSAVTAASGQSMLVLPGKTACLKCLIPNAVYSDKLPTTNNSGIIAPIVSIIASISASTAIRYIVEKYIDYDLKLYDVWTHDFRKVKIECNSKCTHCKLFNSGRK